MATHMQWHQAVHQRWAREQLVFWRLGFHPTYTREEVPDAIDAVCEQHNICGRTIYEVFGQHDLLARFWIPDTAPIEDVDASLKVKLRPFHLDLCDNFVVSAIRRHWFWDSNSGSGTGRTKAPDPELPPRPSDKELRAASDLVERFNKGEIDRAAVEKDKLARTCLETGLLHERGGELGDEPGIKFAIIVTPSSQHSDYRAVDGLGDRLDTVLGDAQHIAERSLYQGNGFGRFLLLGKVPREHFYQIGDGLINPIVDRADLAGLYRTRSLTYIANSPDLLRFSEALYLPSQSPVREPVDVMAMLEAGESARVEFKASIFHNVNRWLHGDRLVEAPEVWTSFVWAVVAMLNGTGGTVITGLLEESIRKYGEHPKLADEPRVEGLILLGAEIDGLKDWDVFTNRLRQKLEAAIEPNPMDLLDITGATVQGRTLCVVSVKAGMYSWFYVREGEDQYRFVVRRGASSKGISGPEEDRFKRLNPRN